MINTRHNFFGEESSDIPHFSLPKEDFAFSKDPNIQDIMKLLKEFSEQDFPQGSERT